MSLLRKLKSWSQNTLITQQQADAIFAFEHTHRSSLFLKFLNVIGCICIGLGICVIVGDKWIDIPTAGRWAILIFLLLAFATGLYWSIKSKHSGLRELFLILELFTVMAGVALTDITYGLNMSPQALGNIWLVCSLPFIFFSRSLILTIIYSFLGLSTIPPSVMEQIKVFNTEHVYSFMLVTGALVVLSYVFKLIYNTMPFRIVVFKALSILAMFYAYITVWFGGSFWHSPYRLFFASQVSSPELSSSLFVFAFFIARMIYAVVKIKPGCFARNLACAIIWSVVLIAIGGIPTVFKIGMLWIGTGIGFLVSVFVTKKLFGAIQSSHQQHSTN